MPRNSLYAVEFRYDTAPDDRCDALDKPLIRGQVAVLRPWVLERVKEEGWRQVVEVANGFRNQF